MDLFSLLSNNKDVTGNFIYVMAIFVALAAWRIYKDRAILEQQQHHLSWLSIGLVASSLTFIIEPLWAFWSGGLSIALCFWAYVLTRISSVKVSLALKGVASFIMMTSVAGMISGMSPSVSLGPSMWPQAPKKPNISLLDTYAYNSAPPTYGDDIEFMSENIPVLNKDALLPWGKGRFRKRVWALPNDTIKVTPNQIFVNGKLIADCTLNDKSEIIQKMPKVWFCYAHFPNGKTQKFVWGEVNDLLYPTFEVQLKEGEMFVIGDNTVESADSREHGAILQKWVIGRFALPPSNEPWKAW